MILSWKVHDPLLALLLLLMCALLLLLLLVLLVVTADELTELLLSIASTGEEIEVEVVIEEEEGASDGTREDFCGVASTDRASSSLLALGLLSASTSN